MRLAEGLEDLLGISLHLLIRLGLLVALLAHAEIALPAIVDALALRDVLRADVALVDSIGLPLLQRVAVGAIRLHGTAHGATAHRSKEHLLQAAKALRSAGGLATTPAAALLILSPSLPLEGRTAGHTQELIEEHLLVVIHVLVVTAEESGEEIRGMLEVVGLLELLGINAPCGVVETAALRVREDLVRRRDLLELRSGRRVVRVLVRMPLQRKAPIGLPDVADLGIRSHV
mmetsp:Transcript_49115/g.104974  ORF Transcript_49115/g.104974 Transcript_49115/m.104974 type:complete len:231 (+) Transcript_49115:451-1143(+)